ncbi:hypothetical protein BpHYR1_050915 [Brachionus plicatilis]|uniref:Uncharacterized protein n=1 Tax=Brachionus plicatilis TaxID=10195 RepID=A0A3M7RJK6_BRAPC|nr:hypothetical protein BpHYR1_050915 [Brachionus plicatilis]
MKKLKIIDILIYLKKICIEWKLFKNKLSSKRRDLAQQQCRSIKIAQQGVLGQYLAIRKLIEHEIDHYHTLSSQQNHI